MTAAYFAIGAALFAIGATQATKVKSVDAVAQRKAKQAMLGFYIAGGLFLLAGVIGMSRGSA